MSVPEMYEEYLKRSIVGGSIVKFYLPYIDTFNKKRAAYDTEYSEWYVRTHKGDMEFNEKMCVAQKYHIMEHMDNLTKEELTHFGLVLCAECKGVYK